MALQAWPSSTYAPAFAPADGILFLNELHSNVHIITLSPHVAKFANLRYEAAGIRNKVDWLLPLVGHEPQNPCSKDVLDTCLAGFAIQVGVSVGPVLNVTRLVTRR